MHTVAHTWCSYVAISNKTVTTQLYTFNTAVTLKVRSDVLKVHA